MTTVTRRYRFPASHRLHASHLSESENRELYGKCNNPYGHGHDYILEVAATGEIHSESGLVLPISQLDRLVTEKALRLFAYRYINKDVPAFEDLVPTTENVVLYIADLLAQHWSEYVLDAGVRLSRVSLQETDRNGFEVLLGVHRQLKQRAQRETVLAGN